MIGCFYEHGLWVALHLQSHPEAGDTLVVARLGECPGDADGRDIPLARRRTAGAALDPALHRLTAGWRHAADEPAAPPAAPPRRAADPRGPPWPGRGPGGRPVGGTQPTSRRRRPPPRGRRSPIRRRSTSTRSSTRAAGQARPSRRGPSSTTRSAPTG